MNFKSIITIIIYFVLINVCYSQYNFEEIYLPEFVNENANFHGVIQSESGFYCDFSNTVSFFDFETEEFREVLSNEEYVVLSTIDVIDQENIILAGVHKNNDAQIQIFQYNVNTESKILLDTIETDNKLSGFNFNSKTTEGVLQVFGYLTFVDNFSYLKVLHLEIQNDLEIIAKVSENLPYMIFSRPGYFFDFNILEKGIILLDLDKAFLFDIDMNFISTLFYMDIFIQDGIRLVHGKFRNVEVDNMSVIFEHFYNPELVICEIGIKEGSIYLSEPTVYIPHNSQANLSFSNYYVDSMKEEFYFTTLFSGFNGDFEFDSISIFSIKDNQLTKVLNYDDNESSVFSYMEKHENNYYLFGAAADNGSFNSPKIVIASPVESSSSDVMNTDINISPNPTSNYITISSSEEIENVYILNSSGHVLSTHRDMNESTMRIDLEMTPGLYFTKIVMENGQEVMEKVMVVD